MHDLVVSFLNDYTKLLLMNDDAIVGSADRVFYVTRRSTIPEASALLTSYAKNVLKPLYARTRSGLGHELRDAVECRGGSWSIRRPFGEYDTLNVPFQNGFVVIERPWLPDDKPYRVSYFGNDQPATEEINTFLRGLLDEAHALGIPRKSKQYVPELCDLLIAWRKRQDPSARD